MFAIRYKPQNLYVYYRGTSWYSQEAVKFFLEDPVKNYTKNVSHYLRPNKAKLFTRRYDAERWLKWVVGDLERYNSLIALQNAEINLEIVEVTVPTVVLPS